MNPPPPGGGGLGEGGVDPMSISATSLHGTGLGVAASLPTNTMLVTPSSLSATPTVSSSGG